jgi:hypothetical protein
MPQAQTVKVNPELKSVANLSLSFHYVYIKSEDTTSNPARAYDLLFEETLKHLETKGIHLHL